MEEQEPFLDPSLTIRSLARRLGMGQRELYCLINQQLGVHFFDFVNRYRVGNAAAVLIDPATPEMSVLELALETGFNPKYSFHAAIITTLGCHTTEYHPRALPRA